MSPKYIPPLRPELEGYLGSEEVHGRSFETLPDVVGRTMKTISAATELGPKCESPIEVDLGAHLTSKLPKIFKVIPQYRFKNYRMDFAIIDQYGKPILFIECDGRAFHSTADQIARDAKKDQAAASAGIHVMRFTGSEIFKNPVACCYRVLVILGYSP